MLKVEGARPALIVTTPVTEELPKAIAAKLPIDQLVDKAPKPLVAATIPVEEPAPSARVVEMPAGYPKTVDLTKLAAAAREILSAQGLSLQEMKGVEKLHLTDADLTLFDSPVIPVLLRHKGSGQILQSPDGSGPLKLGIGADRDVKRDYDKMVKAHPEISWDSYVAESAQASHLANILAAKPIMPAIHAVRRANKDDKSREIVVTARGGDDSVVAGLRQYLDRFGAKLDGALMMYHPTHKAQLGLDGAEGQGRKKALSMAALLALFDPSAATLKRVRFIDDNDENLVRAMELLPKLFPQIRFEFVDVIHVGGGKFEPKLVARSTKGGAVKDAEGKAMSAERIAAYKSTDAALPPPIVQG